MEKEKILVRVISLERVKDLLEDLRRADIECHEKLYKNEISTKNVLIKCVRVPLGANQLDYVRGERAVGCFYFDEKASNYITKGSNVCEGYMIEEYVKEMNEMGY